MEEGGGGGGEAEGGSGGKEEEVEAEAEVMGEGGGDQHLIRVLCWMVELGQVEIATEHQRLSYG